MTKKVNKLYDMKLHETIKIPVHQFVDYHITRVPMGWIYLPYNHALNKAGDPMFIPYNNEFSTVHDDEDR